MPFKPSAPTLLSATDTSVTLQFYKPTDNGGSEIIEYELYMNDGNSLNEPTTKDASYTSNSLTHTVSGLSTGLIYKFKFRAINEVGNSEDSDIVQYASVLRPSAPAAPTVM